MTDKNIDLSALLQQQEEHKKRIRELENRLDTIQGIILRKNIEIIRNIHG